MDHLFVQVGPLLARCRQYNTCNSVRVEITPAERLAVTLRFLATGNSQVSSLILCWPIIFQLFVCVCVCMFDYSQFEEFIKYFHSAIGFFVFQFSNWEVHYM